MRESVSSSVCSTPVHEPDWRREAAESLMWHNLTTWYPLNAVTLLCVSQILACTDLSSCSFSQNILQNMATAERTSGLTGCFCLLQHQHNKLDTNWNIFWVYSISNPSLTQSAVKLYFHTESGCYLAHIVLGFIILTQSSAASAPCVCADINTCLLFIDSKWAACQNLQQHVVLELQHSEFSLCELQ